MPFLEDFIGHAYEIMARAVNDLFPEPESKPLPETVADPAYFRPAYTEENNFQEMLLFLKPG